MSYLELVEAELQEFQIELPLEQRVALGQYCEELHRWNEKVNLTGLSGIGLVRRLVMEPVWIARQLPFGGSLVDIGSGNGSPAIPFQVVSRFGSCRLVESRGKRAAFLRHVCAMLKLEEVVVHRGRFEEVVATLGKADWVSLQAVALSESILKAIRAIVTTTTMVVWITSATAVPLLEPVRRLTVPITGTQVLLFHLDLS